MSTATTDPKTIVVAAHKRSVPKAPKVIEPKFDLADADFESDDDTDATPAAVPSAPAGNPTPPAAPPGEALATPPAPVASRHSPRLLRLAEMVGIKPHEAEAMDAAALKEEIDLANREIEITQRLSSAQNAAHQSRHEARQPLPPAPVAPEPEEQIDWGTNPETQSPYTENDYAKPVRDAVKAAHEARKEAKRLREELAKERESRQNESFIDYLERRFVERPDLFGKGASGTLKPDSRELGRRRSVFNLVMGLQNAPGPLAAKYDYVLNTLFDPAAPPPAPSAPAAPAAPASVLQTPPAVVPAAPAAGRNGHSRITEEQFEAAALAKPGTRKQVPEKKGIARAKQRFQERMKELGLDDSNVSMPEEEAELPD